MEEVLRHNRTRDDGGGPVVLEELMCEKRVLVEGRDLFAKDTGVVRPSFEDKQSTAFFWASSVSFEVKICWRSERERTARKSRSSCSNNE